MLQTLIPLRANSAGAPPPITGANKVDISRGERIDRVSSEGFSRPDNQHLMSLTGLDAAGCGRAERAARTAMTKALRVEASRDNAGRLTLMIPGRADPLVLRPALQPGGRASQLHATTIRTARRN